MSAIANEFPQTQGPSGTHFPHPGFMPQAAGSQTLRCSAGPLSAGLPVSSAPAHPSPEGILPCSAWGCSLHGPTHQTAPAPSAVQVKTLEGAPGQVITLTASTPPPQIRPVLLHPAPQPAGSGPGSHSTCQSTFSGWQEPSPVAPPRSLPGPPCLPPHWAPAC